MQSSAGTQNVIRSLFLRRGKNLINRWHQCAEKEEETQEQIQVLAESIKRYKKFRRNQLMFQQDQQQLPALKKMSSLDQGRCSVQTLLAGQVIVVDLKECNVDVVDSWLSRVHIKAPTMSYETSRLVSTQSRCLELVLLKHQYNHDHAIQASKFFLKFYIMVNLKANVVEQYWNFDKFLNFGSIQCSFKYLKKVLCTIEDSTNLTSFKCQWCAIKTGWKVSTLIDILILKQLFCWCKDSIP